MGPLDTVACTCCREGRRVLWQFMIYLGTMSSCQMQQRMVRGMVNGEYETIWNGTVTVQIEVLSRD